MNAVEIVRDLLDSAIKRGPNADMFQRQLASREIDRRLEAIGAEVFDPHGFVRAAIRARDLIEFADECTEAKR